MIIQRLGYRRSSESHEVRQFVLFIRLVVNFQFFIFDFLFEVEFLHDSGEGMVSITVMALVEDDEGVICDFNVASAQTVEKHLRDHHSDGSFLHFV